MLGKCAAKRLTQKAWDEVTLDFSLTFHAASRPLSSDLCMGGRSRTGHMEEGLDLTVLTLRSANQGCVRQSGSFPNSKLHDPRSKETPVWRRAAPHPGVSSY